jgi:hypothetical protein
MLGGEIVARVVVRLESRPVGREASLEQAEPGPSAAAVEAASAIRDERARRAFVKLAAGVSALRGRERD